MLFRAGRADEEASSSGKTHLVEHLALPAQSRRRISFNGSVDNALTTFWASGDESQVRTFLETTARSLSALPLERLETERQILLAEEATEGPNPTRLAFALRYGSVGHGLTGHDQYGLRRLTSEEVSAWTAERFTRENVALWLTGPAPGELELDLPGGEHHLPPEPWTIPEAAESFPALYRGGAQGAIAFSLDTERTVAFRVGLSILRHRIQDRIRFELGLSYEVETIFIPLTADRVHAVLVSDASEQNARRVSAEMLETLDALAAEGPTGDELEEELTENRVYSADPTGLTSQLYYAALQHLLGQPDPGTNANLAEQERLTPADVARAMDDVRKTLLAIVPETVESLPGLGDYPVSSRGVIAGGRRFRPPGLRLRRAADAPELLVGEEGVVFTAGAHRVTVPYNRCTVALRYGDGGRLLLSDDGFFAAVRPDEWKHWREAVAAIDAAVPEELVAVMEPELSEQVDAVEATAKEKLKRRWTVSDELAQLPGRLAPGETVVTMCEAARGMRLGLLAVTDRRVIFFALIRKETWIEFGYDEIESVKGTNRPWRTAVTLEARGEKVVFSDVSPKQRALEIAAEIESRRAG